MPRLPEPHAPLEDMTELERLQYIDARLWHSRHLELCFVCEEEWDLVEWRGGLVCPRCRSVLEEREALADFDDEGWVEWT